MKQVQIPMELFRMLLHYHILDETDCAEDIVIALNQKLNSMIDRKLYTQYKTAPTEEEKERARQEYLDRKGYHPDWRW